MQSRRFLADFIERHNLLVPIMATKEWDESADALRYQDHLYDTVSGKWVRKVRAPRQQTPTFLEAQQFFKDNFLSVSQDKKTGFVTVAVEFYSPQMASTWTQLLIDDLNREIMQRDVTQAENAIEYLNSQIEGTALADLRRVFSRLIEEQTKTIMLAAVSEEYLLKTLDPPVPPEFRSAPRRSVIVLASVFLAGVFGVLIALAVGGRRTG